MKPHHSLHQTPGLGVCVGGDYISIPRASQHVKHYWGRLIGHISRTWQDKTRHAVVGPSPISVLLKG